MDERAFFPESSGTSRSFPDSYYQLSMGTYKSYSNSQFQSISDNPRQQEEQHCFVLGTDFKSPKSITKGEKESETDQRPLRHFFTSNPETTATTDSWLDLASNSRISSGDDLASSLSSLLYFLVCQLLFILTLGLLCFSLCR